MIASISGRKKWGWRAHGRCRAGRPASRAADRQGTEIGRPRPGFDHDHRDRIGRDEDRKSTRLNSSHVEISYAVFCLKKKKLTTRWGEGFAIVVCTLDTE